MRRPGPIAAIGVVALMLSAAPARAGFAGRIKSTVRNVPRGEVPR